MSFLPTDYPPVLAIDPGTEKSGWVIYDHGKREIQAKGIDKNADLLDKFRGDGAKVVIEMIASYGMPVGKDVFETCVWIGRFIDAFGGEEWVDRIYRKEVCLHLCQSNRASDANIRRALLDMFPKTGGGKEESVGIKAAPGPLYGVTTHMWAALGVAVTYAELEL